MSLRQYITEAEVRQNIPEAGDHFDIELEDGTLLETYIIGVRNSAILLDATPKIIDVLREWADLEGEAGEVLFEGQFKQSMHVAAESMDLEDFVKRYGHLFGPGEAEQFWQAINSTNEDHFADEPMDADAGEYDYEGDMAKDDLETIVRAARRLTGMLDDNENMPEWVQSKINKAADYVDTAADYIESNQDEQGVSEGHETADDYQAKAQWLRQNLHVSPDEAWEMAYDTDPDTWVGSPWEDDYKRDMDEAKYQGREVKLGKPTRGDVKKFKVYVRDPATGNIKKVNFGHGGTSARRAGQKTMKIKKSDPARRRSFRARHNCDNPGPRTKARYWSCRAW